MNLIAIMPPGLTELTVNGLHQWDYGRKLEIHAEDLSAVVEVHFACMGMSEAEVRVCETHTGVAIAEIPNQCLEQTSPITAWVFEINGETGATTKKITLPVTARPRPQPSPTVPTEVSDKYTELITAVNESLDNLKKGDVLVKEAISAQQVPTLAAGLADGSVVVAMAKNATFAAGSESANTAKKADLLAKTAWVKFGDAESTTATVSLADNCLYLLYPNGIGAPMLLLTDSSKTICISSVGIAHLSDGAYVQGHYTYDRKTSKMSLVDEHQTAIAAGGWCTKLAELPALQEQ